jgi:hypothetical protein
VKLATLTSRHLTAMFAELAAGTRPPGNPARQPPCSASGPPSAPPTMPRSARAWPPTIRLAVWRCPWRGVRTRSSGPMPGSASGMRTAVVRRWRSGRPPS